MILGLVVRLCFSFFLFGMLVYCRWDLLYHLKYRIYVHFCVILLPCDLDQV